MDPGFYNIEKYLEIKGRKCRKKYVKNRVHYPAVIIHEYNAKWKIGYNLLQRVKRHFCVRTLKWLIIDTITHPAVYELR